MAKKNVSQNLTPQTLMIKIALLTFFILFFSCNTKRKYTPKSKNDFAHEKLVIKDSLANDYYSQGLKAIRRNNYIDAKNYFNKAYKIENNNPIIVNALASASFGSGDHSRADALYLHAISTDSNYILSYIGYANYLRQKRQLEKANKILLMAIHVKPDDYYKAWIYHDLALVNVDLNKCDDAIEYANKAKIFSSSQDLSYFVKEIESLCKN